MVVIFNCLFLLYGNNGGLGLIRLVVSVVDIGVFNCVRDCIVVLLIVRIVLNCCSSVWCMLVS